MSENKYPDDIMEMVRQRLGLEDDDTSRDDDINAMPRMEVFEHVFVWEGICGYADLISQWINDIFNVNLEDFDDDND